MGYAHGLGTSVESKVKDHSSYIQISKEFKTSVDLEDIK